MEIITNAIREDELEQRTRGIIADAFAKAVKANSIIDAVQKVVNDGASGHESVKLSLDLTNPDRIDIEVKEGIVEFTRWINPSDNGDNLVGVSNAPISGDLSDIYKAIDEILGYETVKMLLNGRELFVSKGWLNALGSSDDDNAMHALFDVRASLVTSTDEDMQHYINQLREIQDDIRKAKAEDKPININAYIAPDFVGTDVPFAVMINGKDYHYGVDCETAATTVSSYIMGFKNAMSAKEENAKTPYKEPRLCGFVWCNGRKDFTAWETDALSDEDIQEIEKILLKYDTCGTSESNVYDSRFSDVFCEEY